MNFLRNLPIKRKLVVITMLVSGAALVTACMAFIAYGETTARKQMAQALAITAAMTGANSTAGLSFDEAGSVAQALNSLSAQPDLVQACVFNKSGRLFARYLRANADKKTALPEPAATGHYFSRDRLALFQPITLAGENIGTIYLEEDLSGISARFWNSLLIVALVLLLCSAVAFFLSAWLQRVISLPLSDLARIVTVVTTEKRYSVRATKSSADELGSLIDGFNEMLAQIQERDATLEQRVALRTRELAESLSVLHATLESTADGMLVIDHQERVVSSNNKFLEMWRIPRDKMSAGRDGELLALASEMIKDDTAFLSKVREIYRQPDTETFDVIELKDGRIFERYSIPQRLDGEVMGRVWSFRDVTERKKIEREIVESRNFLDRIINSISDPVFVKDRQHRWVLINDAGCAFVGASREDILGKTIYDIFPKAEADVFWLKDQQVFESRRENINEEKFTDTAGRHRTIVTKKNLYVDENGELFIVGVIQDITERQRAAEALRESEANYYSLVDQMPAGIFRKDNEGRYVFVNSWFCRFRGVRPEDYLGKLPQEVAAASAGMSGGMDLHRLMKLGEQHHREIMQTGRQIEVEENYQSSDGNMVHHHVIKSPVFGPDGAVVGSQGILMDITQRKLAEAELNFERELLRALLDNSEEVVYFKDLDSRFIRASAAMARQFGVASPDLLLGKRDTDFFLPEHAQAALCDEQEIIRTGNPVIGKLEKETWPDGRITWALSNKLPLRDAGGNIIGTFGISKDITALKEAQERAAREKARFKIIFDSVPVGISLARVGADGQLLERHINDAHLQICGLSRDQNEDLTIYGRITHPEDRRRQAEFSPLIESGELSQFTMEKRYVRFDGTIVWVNFSFQRRQVPDGGYEDLCTVSDITRNKAAEEERDKLNHQLVEASRRAGMAEVATSVLHNVGNVLNSINVSTTLVLDMVKRSRLNSLDRLATLVHGERERLVEFFTSDVRGKQLPDYLMKLVTHLADEQMALVREIELTRKNIEHIKDIVAMQQSYAKVSGVVEKVKVTELVEDALRMNAGALTRHNVQVRRDYPADPVEIYVERQKVLQILVNLIRNAKYACDDSGRADKWLMMQVRVVENRVEIIAQDNGVGIPAENLTRIFNHGFTTRENGHGFGLHSGALAAKEMGGALRAQSDGPGLGAFFTLELPLKTQSNASNQSPESAP
jgi:PAS domain S-box-containing protein